MSIKIDLDAIDARLDHGAKWITGWGDYQSPDGKTCLHGAIRHCQPIPGDAYLIEQVGRRHGFGTEDNDSAGSWEQLRASVPAEVTDAMLAETFGPQWEAIVALVRRAAVLTVDEVHSLAAARGAAGIDARNAAWAAAWATARVAALMAQANDAWAAAGAAAGLPACALVVRDLIDAHSFTQAHYDTLTGPWRQVIGPVHPDDLIDALTKESSND